MKATTVIAGFVVTFSSLVPLCPAPINGLIGGLLAGVIGGTTRKMIGTYAKRDGLYVVGRQHDPFAGLPHPAADQCKGQLENAVVSFSPLDGNGVHIDGVPSACMTLPNVFLGQNPDQPAPTPMGSASLEYHSLSDDQLQQALNVSNNR